MPTKAGASGPLHPQVLWAQRENVLYLTFDVDDMKIDDLSVTQNQLHIKGAGGHEKTLYECSLEFYGDLDAESYRRIAGDRRVELVIPKKLDAGKGSWWPRLLKSSGRVAWIKVDFNKWKDEDESDKEGEDQFDLNNMMRNLGGAGAGGGMGAGDIGMPPPDLGDFDDSDNEDLPDLEDDAPEEEEGKEDESKTQKDKTAGSEVQTSEQATTADENEVK